MTRTPRYGWRLDTLGKQIEDIKEQKAIVDIATAHARGESNAEIAASLRRKRVPGPGRERGGDGRWWPQTVKGILSANRSAIAAAVERVALERVAQPIAEAKKQELLRVQREELWRLTEAEGGERFTFHRTQSFSFGYPTGPDGPFGISAVVDELSSDIDYRVRNFIENLRLVKKVRKQVEFGAA